MWPRYWSSDVCSSDLISEAAHGFYAGVFQRGKLLIGGAFTTGDDGTGVAHALAGRRRNTRDVGHHRLGHVGFDVRRRFFLSAATEFADHDDGFGLGIVLEHFENVDR